MKPFVLVLVALVALVASQTTTVSEVAVVDTDLTCKLSSDCQVTMNSCRVGCGVAVNTAGASRVATELGKICNTFVLQSDALCPDSVPKCEAGKCVLAPIPGPVKVDPSKQTCKANTDCTVTTEQCQRPCCLAADVGISIANLEAHMVVYNRTCAGVPPSHCELVLCAAMIQEPTCVKGYCTVNGADPVLIPPPPPPVCDVATKPNELCKCVRTPGASSSTTAGSWICPLTCPGVPPKGCYCSAAEATTDITATTSLQYTCLPEVCANVRLPMNADATRCQCHIPFGTVTQLANTPASTPVTLTPQWSCPPAPCCSDVVNIDPASTCSSADAKIWCDQTTCQWKYSCPPPPVCTCANLPVPTLDPAVDGCSTRDATWFCAATVGVTSTGTVVSIGADGQTSTVNPATPGKKRQQTTTPIRDCAYLDYKCNTTSTCVASYACGFQCYDSSQPMPMIACLPPNDPVTNCEQRCLQKFSKCLPLTVTGVRTCTSVTSADYEYCVKQCRALPPPPTDKCTFIRDRCNCERNGCGWCSGDVGVTDPVLLKEGSSAVSSVNLGFCASPNSKLQCITRAMDFATTDPAIAPRDCPIIIPVDPIPLPVEPTVPVIDKCLMDNRCASTTVFNQAIKDAVANAQPDDVGKLFVIIITAVIQSDGGIVNLAVDVQGDREPTVPERPKICKIVSDSIAKTLKFDASRIQSCLLSKVNGAKKRSVEAVSNSYVANLKVSTAQDAGAEALLPAALAFLGAALALF